MKTYLAHLKAKGVKAVPTEFSLNIALALYAQIDELEAENKLLADTAAKLAKELKQADKLADALENILFLAQIDADDLALALIALSNIRAIARAVSNEWKEK